MSTETYARAVIRQAAIDKTDGKSLRSGFLQHAAQRPDAPAFVVRGMTHTYGEVDQTARVWAHSIMRLAGGPAERVAVFGYRSAISYAGTFAAMYCGAAFVPLNPTFPVEKTAEMLEQADVDAVIVDNTAAPQLENVLRRVSAPPPVLLPDFDTPSSFSVDTPVVDRRELAGMKPLDALPPLIATDLAYLLFTSGSTGKPKGVPVTHSNVRHFLDVTAERYGIRPEDRFSQTADQTFDLCIPELYLPWDCGACVYSMAPNDLLSPAGFVNRHEISVWISVPSVPALMRKRKLLKPGIFPTLRWSLFCGEPLAQASAEAWQEAAPSCALENMYGPTEVTVACFTHRWDPASSPELCVNGAVAIGRPFPGLGALLVGDDMAPVGEGVAGELCVWGPQTTSGYWNAPEKTAERYVRLPVSRTRQELCYRTGDRAMRLPGSGEYVCLGRVDHQVKVLGHRVELGEVEALLCRDRRVVHAVAFGWPVAEDVAQGLVAFVSGHGVDVADLKKRSRAALPAYMQPSDFIVMEDLPLSPNGKVNRLALRKLLDQGLDGSPPPNGARSRET